MDITQENLDIVQKALGFNDKVAQKIMVTIKDLKKELYDDTREQSVYWMSGNDDSSKVLSYDDIIEMDCTETFFWGGFKGNQYDMDSIDLYSIEEFIEEYNCFLGTYRRYYSKINALERLLV